MRAFTPLALSLLFGLSASPGPGCSARGTCVDSGPDAWVTDLGHDQVERLLTFAVSRRLGYCSGNDEKRYSHERVTVDLETRAVDVEQRYSEGAGGYDLLEVGFMRHLYRDGHFGSAGACTRCELVLEAEGVPRYRYRLIMHESEASPLVLEVIEDGEPIMVLDLGYARTTEREG